MPRLFHTRPIVSRRRGFGGLRAVVILMQHFGNVNLNKVLGSAKRGGKGPVLAVV
jgi:hypothetical protein